MDKIRIQLATTTAVLQSSQGKSPCVMCVSAELLQCKVSRKGNGSSTSIAPYLVAMPTIIMRQD